MIHSVLISTDNQFPPLEMVELGGFKNLEDFHKARAFYDVYDNGASHHLFKIDVLLYRKLSAMSKDEQLKHINFIDWTDYYRETPDELPF
tara:strand:- start:243 stop:512 length:270 start_codon:yes stop_codon:yes gene_type:complete